MLICDLEINSYILAVLSSVSDHLSRRLIGELLAYIHASGVCPSVVCQHFQTTFSLKPIAYSERGTKVMCFVPVRQKLWLVWQLIMGKVEIDNFAESLGILEFL